MGKIRDIHIYELKSAKTVVQKNNISLAHQRIEDFWNMHGRLSLITGKIKPGK